MVRSWLPVVSTLIIALSHPILISHAVIPTCQSCVGGGGVGCGNVGGDGSNPVDGGGGGDGCSPIIVDVSGRGFQLTNAQSGVQFDITGTGKPIQIAWTAQGSMNAFLVLDRNNDGLINSGSELFGNFSPQPKSLFPNGFAALAEYDKEENGGNGDGIIDNRDAIFSELRLWIDSNHDGISQPDELFKLPDMGLFSISLAYKESRRVDQFGNLFRYRSEINVFHEQRDQSKASPVAYDVFLTTN